jgi:hypothetical protein
MMSDSQSAIERLLMAPAWRRPRPFGDIGSQKALRQDFDFAPQEGFKLDLGTGQVVEHRAGRRVHRNVEVAVLDILRSRRRPEDPGIGQAEAGQHFADLVGMFG